MRLFAARFLAPQERADAPAGHGRACNATGSAPSSTPCSSLPRGRGDQLPSGAQLFFAVVLIGTARASMSGFKVEQTMFLKLDQGCLPEVQKNNAVFLKLDQECLPEVQKNNAVVASRRNQCLQDVQSAQEAAAGETVDVET